MKNKKTIIGVDIGGTTCIVILGDETGKIFDRIVFATEVKKGKDYTIDKICREIKVLENKYQLTSKDISCIGISCGGPLDSYKGLILSPPNLPGWDEVPISKIISDKIGVKACLENDANASALAEWIYGAGKGYSNLIFLTFGTGLGAGLILDGRLYRGQKGLSGEVGHIRLANDGPVGHNKAGSFEGFCSGGGIAKMARQELTKQLTDQEIKEIFAKGINEITAQDIGIAATLGNKYAQEILAESGNYLGKGLSILMDIFDPQIIIIGGIYVRCQQFLEPYANSVVQKEVLPEIAKNCRIVPAKLGESIGDYASLSVARLHL